MDLAGIEFVIVGAGLSGLTVARRLTDHGRKVLIIEKQGKIGGLCSSYPDPDTGIECHSFGTHILHSSDHKVVQFLSRFCHLNHYRHRVLAWYKGKTYPIPINLQTINSFFNTNLDPATAKELLSGMAQQGLYSKGRSNVQDPQTLEGIALAKIGAELYEAFIEGYSQKQWGVHPRDLPAALLSRIPVRTDYTPDYFLDYWQGLPIDGYESLFSRLVRGLPALILSDYAQVRGFIPPGIKTVYTGCLDEYFEYKFGRLPWRSVRFDTKVVGIRDFQGCAVMNYPETCFSMTRIHEFKHLYPERICTIEKTVVSWEYPTESGSPAYPVFPDGELARKYREAADQEAAAGIYFCGRLGTYRYLDMDQAVKQALTLADELSCQT